MAVLKSGCTHGCAPHEYDTHVKVETRWRMSSQPKGTISLISQCSVGLNQHSFIHSPYSRQGPALSLLRPSGCCDEDMSGPPGRALLNPGSSKPSRFPVGKMVPFSDEETRTCPGEGQTAHRWCSRVHIWGVQRHLPPGGAQGCE